VSKSLQGIAEKCCTGWTARPVKPGVSDHSKELERVRFPSPIKAKLGGNGLSRERWVVV